VSASRVPRRVWIAELRADLRGYGKLLLVLLGNGLACWIIAQVVGGSALIGEVPHHQPPFIEMDGERVIVPWWLYQFSFWHGLSVVLSVLWLVPFTACLVCEHGLAWARYRCRPSVNAGSA